MFTKMLGTKLPGIGFFVVAIYALLVLQIMPALAAKSKPIITTLQREGNFTTFLKAINEAGMAKTLHSHGPYTVFAPTDDAFAKMPAAERNDLLSDKARLRRLVNFHVIHTQLSAADLSAQKASSTPNTLEGDPLRVTSAAGVVTVNGAAIVKADVPASNGTIHEIDTVLMPPNVISVPPGPKSPAPVPPAPASPPPAANPPPANPPATPPSAKPAPVNPPASPPTTTPTPDNPTAPINLPMQPANPPGAPVNPPGSPGTPLPEQPAPNQPAPTPANPPGNTGTPPGSTAPATPTTPANPPTQ